MPPVKPRIVPRVPPPRGKLNFDYDEVEAFLVAFGDDDHPLPETVKVLDEIITDFIIETCHEAAACAHHSRRAKIKVDDFKFMLRRDPTKLGRVSELLDLDKDLRRKRKAFDTDEGAVVKNNEKEGPAGKAGEKDKDKGGEKDGKRKDGEREGGDGERKKKKKKKSRDRGEDGTTVVSG